MSEIPALSFGSWSVSRVYHPGKANSVNTCLTKLALNLAADDPHGTLGLEAWGGENRPGHPHSTAQGPSLRTPLSTTTGPEGKRQGTLDHVALACVPPPGSAAV